MVKYSYNVIKFLEKFTDICQYIDLIKIKDNVEILSHLKKAYLSD
jgi:hypothetical protein